MELDSIGRPIRKASALGSRRRRWVLGVGVAVLLLLGLIGFVLWWDAPPVVAPDLEPEPLPPLADDENGRVPFDRVAVPEHPRMYEALRMTRAPHQVGDSWPTWDPSLAEEVLAHSEPLLDVADEALSRPGFQFEVTRFDQLLMPVLPIQNASHAMKLDAWSRFRTGDEEGAVLRATELCELGRRVRDGNGAFFTWFVGHTSSSIGTVALLHFSAETDDRDVIRAALHYLNDHRRHDASASEQIERAICREFAMSREFLERSGREAVVVWMSPYTGASTPEPWRRLLAKPNRSLGLFAELLRELQRNALCVPSDWAWPVADSFAEADHSWPDLIDPNLIGTIAITERARFLKLIARRIPQLQTQQRFALLMAALRLYEMDHGELPATLEALVPEYLDELPPDPYTDEALQYDPARRMVWSVGEELVDRGGETVEFSGSEWRAEPTLIIP